MKETNNNLPANPAKIPAQVVPPIKQAEPSLGANEQQQHGRVDAKQIAPKVVAPVQPPMVATMAHEPSGRKVPSVKGPIMQRSIKHTSAHHDRPVPIVAAEISTNRPDTSGSLFSMRLFNAERDLPIVYSSHYNISIVGLELLHQFDTKKYGKIAHYLSAEFLDTPFARARYHGEAHDEGEENNFGLRRLRFMRPNRPISKRELELHHSAEFVRRIHEEKSLVARITEVWAINLVPSSSIEYRLLTPIKWQVAGTIFATYLAMQHGWAINLGGGFHQSTSNTGETFCLFSDMMLAIKHVWQKHPLQKFMIIDLDAHQATGVERDLAGLDAKWRSQVFMVDMFNTAVQPPDQQADKEINLRVELKEFTGDETYLKLLKDTLTTAFEKFKPTIVIYVSGQDVLRDDQLGLLNLSDTGLKRRDEMVVSSATERGCPIVMLLGGGYLKRGAKVQADSIRNLFAKGIIWGGHRSGLRSLSRPRPNLVKSRVETQQSASKTRSASISHPPPVRKVAPTIRAAPVEPRFLHKKAPPTNDDSAKKA